jgi:hypothetical protein
MLYVPQGESETASHHNGIVFWETIKRCQQIGNLHIVAFAAYGYKGAWDYSSATRTIDVSPSAIPENTWGIEDMRFTEDEYKDYFLRFCRTHLGKMKNEEDIKFLQEYVHKTTALHPGLVAFFMNHIRDHFSPQLKYNDTLTFGRIFLYLKSYGFMRAVDEASVSILFCAMKKDCIIVLIKSCYCRAFVGICICKILLKRKKNFVIGYSIDPLISECHINIITHPKKQG